MTTDRPSLIPYGRQQIDDDDIAAVVDVLRGDWLTTGPAVDRFEQAFAELVGASHAVAVANGTAALHLAMLAAGVGPGDEVIVPTFTFAASANAARYVGADVVFADVLHGTLGVDLEHVESLVTSRTRAIVVVDYAGIPCDLDDAMTLAEKHGIVVVEDACHAVGASYRGRPVGSIATLSTFSFHPVKHLTTAEGGMVTTEDAELARRLRRLRNHGIDTDLRTREQQGTWQYDVVELGFNYRLSDLGCALGASQVPKVRGWVERRRELADRYRTALSTLPLRLLEVPDDREPSWHLFPVLVTDATPLGRDELVEGLRSSGIGATLHYRPVHQHTLYRDLVDVVGTLPVAERAGADALTLPLWHGMTDAQQDRVVARLHELVGG